MKATVVVPVYNEAENLPVLISRLTSIAEKMGTGYSFSYLFVNDGSSDGTLNALQAARESNPDLHYVTLSRNFGHQAALSAGLSVCPDSDVVIMMDGDLQDPPEVIPEFLEQYEKGSDVVYAIRSARPEGLLKRFCYRTFYLLANRLSNIPLPIESGDFSLVSWRVRGIMVQADERLRYLRGLRAYAGFTQTGITVDRGERHSGEPKYTTGRLIGLALDGLFSFSMVPLRAAWLAGAVGIVSCVLYTGHAIVKKMLFGSVLEGFTGTIAAVTFLGSLQLLFIGIVGEYVGRIHSEVKRRPVFIVDPDRSTLDG